MSFNLIDAAKALFTPELVNKASAYLGESESGINKAISGIVPTIVSGLIHKASTQEGANTVNHWVNEQHNSLTSYNLSSFLGNENGNMLQKAAGLLHNFFGDKTDGLISLVSNFAGIRQSSGASLLSMALPAVLGLLGRHTTDGSTPATLLSSQKNNVTTAMPAGFNVGNILGSLQAKTSDTGAERSHTVHYSNEKEKKSPFTLNILLPLFLLAGLGLLAWLLFSKGCNNTDTAAADGNDSLSVKTNENSNEVKDNKTATITGKLDSLTGDWYYDDGDLAVLELPNGTNLTVGKNSTEYKLINFLKDEKAIPDTVKGTWFEFTNVHFKKGGTELTDESMGQLKNMVAIAKAYPLARFKFGGYTDNTGSDAVNVPLSQKRATAVAAIITKLGAPAESIVGAEGYGSQWPIASNETKEGQAQNRRVAIRLKSK
ncbi:DUF937 domain-containing protein [Ferruginibacter sp.]